MVTKCVRSCGVHTLLFDLIWTNVIFVPILKPCPQFFNEQRRAFWADLLMLTYCLHAQIYCSNADTENRLLKSSAVSYRQ